MNITFKLYASLSEHLPSGAHNNAIAVEVPDDATIDWVIDHYQVPRKMTHLVLVNGVFFAPEARAEQALAPGDTLAIWPPIAGG